MPARVLLILALIWQSLTLCGVIAPAGSAERCVQTSCCEVVEQVSCCEEVVAHHCGLSRGECLCGVSPVDHPERVPEGPLPRTNRETFAAVQLLVPMPYTGIHSDPGPFRVCAVDGGLLAGKTHNEVQAFLGIWRT